MSRIYTVVFDNVSVSAAQDLFGVYPASNKGCKLRGLKLSQVGTAAWGDSHEEGLQVRITRGNTSSGSGGSAVTPVALDSTDTSAGFTGRTNDTTVASGGTQVNIEELGWNARLSPYETWWPDSEFAPRASSSDGSLCVRLEGAPATALNVSGTLYVEED